MENQGRIRQPEAGKKEIKRAKEWPRVLDVKGLLRQKCGEDETAGQRSAQGMSQKKPPQCWESAEIHEWAHNPVTKLINSQSKKSE